MTSTTACRRTPLYDTHKALGAKLVPFAGWEMPVQYAGILAEHHAVRTGAGVFDVSHMGEFEVTGPDRNALVNRVTCNDVARWSRAACSTPRSSHPRAPSWTTARSIGSRTSS